MESNFHSTVLQRPTAMHDYDEERDRDRDRDRDERRRRDILNPVQLSENGPAAPSAAANSSTSPAATAIAASSSSSATGQPPRQAFSLRSPTQPDIHGPHFPGSSTASPSSASAANSSAAAPNSHTSANGTSSRSGLHNPFLTSAAPPTLPPAAAPPRSPLHAPPHLYYPQDMRDTRDAPRDAPRDKTVSKYYDPTTDTTTTTVTSDRRVSDTGSARHNAPQSQTSPSKVSTPEADRHQ